MKKLLSLTLVMVMAIIVSFDVKAISPITTKTPKGQTVKLYPLKTGTYKVTAVQTSMSSGGFTPASGELYYCQFEECSMMGVDIDVNGKKIRKQFSLFEDWKVDNENQTFTCDSEEDGLNFSASILPIGKNEQAFMYFGDKIMISLIYSLDGFKEQKGEVVLEKILSLP